MKAQLLFERKLKVVRKEPLGHRTPTEVHVYPDRGTCVLRPRYMRPPTEVHAYPDRDAMTFLKQWRQKTGRCLPKTSVERCVGEVGCGLGNGAMGEVIEEHLLETHGEVMVVEEDV